MRLRKTLDAKTVHRIIMGGGYWVSSIEEWGDWISLEKKVTIENFIKDRSIPPRQRLAIILREEFLTLDEITEFATFVVRVSTVCAKERIREIDQCVSTTLKLMRGWGKGQFQPSPEIVKEVLDLLAYNNAMRYAALSFDSKKERFGFARAAVSSAIGMFAEEEAACRRLTKIIRRRER